jgi:hypothetical protein
MSGNTKKVAVVIKDPGQAGEGLRSTAGLLLANHTASMFVLDFEVEASEKYQDDLEFLLEMEGLAYTNLPANAERLGLELLNDEAVIAKLRENEIIIPF